MKLIQEFTDKRLDDYLREFNKEICVQCLTPHYAMNNSQSIIVKKYVLPCQCCVFDENCFLEYLDRVLNNYNYNFTQGKFMLM